MDNLIRRNKERALLEDPAEIIRQREARYRAELERMAVDQEARITGLDDRDRRTLEAIRAEIRDVKVTIQDVGGAPATAPAPTYAWELTLLSPAGGAQFQFVSDLQDFYAVHVRVGWRLNAPLGPSEAAEAVLQAGRLYCAFGDGNESELTLMSLDGQDTYADGAYSGVVDFGLHSYPPGAYTVAASGGGPLGGTDEAVSAFTVLDYIAPVAVDYWTWDGASCAAHSGPAIPAGAYGSLAACQAAHPPPVTFYIWDGSACQLQTAPAAPAGSYPTLTACQQAHPAPPAWHWDGSLCVQQAGGEFASFEACLAAHPPVPAGLSDWRIDATAPADGTLFHLTATAPTYTALLSLTWSASLGRVAPKFIVEALSGVRARSYRYTAPDGNVLIADLALDEGPPFAFTLSRVFAPLPLGSLAGGSGAQQVRFQLYRQGPPVTILAERLITITAGF